MQIDKIIHAGNGKVLWVNLVECQCVDVEAIVAVVDKRVGASVSDTSSGRTRVSLCRLRAGGDEGANEMGCALVRLSKVKVAYGT